MISHGYSGSLGWSKVCGLCTLCSMQVGHFSDISVKSDFILGHQMDNLARAIILCNGKWPSWSLSLAICLKLGGIYILLWYVMTSPVRARSALCSENGIISSDNCFLWGHSSLMYSLSSWQIPSFFCASAIFSPLGLPLAVDAWLCGSRFLLESRLCPGGLPACPCEIGSGHLDSASANFGSI